MTLKRSTGQWSQWLHTFNEHLPMIARSLGGKEIPLQTVLTVMSVTAVVWLCALPVVCLYACVCVCTCGLTAWRASFVLAEHHAVCCPLLPLSGTAAWCCVNKL